MCGVFPKAHAGREPPIWNQMLILVGVAAVESDVSILKTVRPTQSSLVSIYRRAGTE